MSICNNGREVILLVLLFFGEFPAGDIEYLENIFQLITYMFFQVGKNFSIFMTITL